VNGAGGAAFEIISQFYTGSVYSYAPIPEPTTMTLIGLGLSGLAARRRAKKRKNGPVRFPNKCADDGRWRGRSTPWNPFRSNLRSASERLPPIGSAGRFAS
jgi:hypothetical protein